MTGSDINTVGLISDIHANLPALEAVLADMPTVDAIVNAGDIVGYGPWPIECVERIQEVQCYSVIGNHDVSLFEDLYFHESDKYAAEVLSPSQKEWLQALPHQLLLFDDRLRVVHGHPESHFQYTEESAFDPSLLDGESILVLGHTHKQATKHVGDNQLIVNPGSVGQPRDGDPRAAYAVVDLDKLSVSLKRVVYDIDCYTQQLTKTPIPNDNARRLYVGE